MHITTVGDVMLDVIVDAPHGLRPDDDTEATITLSAGGQAANVAMWAAALKASATLIGPRSDAEASQLVEQRLLASGVTYRGIPVDGAGVVVSILTAGTRTLASDPGDQSWLSRITPEHLPEDTDWLHVSSYPLLRSSDPSALVRLTSHAHDRGVSVSVDLASATLISAYGDAAFATLLDRIAPDVVFANQTEWRALGRSFDETGWDVVVKRGRDGVEIRRADTVSRYAAPAVEVVDATGAGDALAAGYVVGGIELALRTAARCVAQLGAQPARSG